MQGNGYPDVFAFNKWPTENYAQCGHTQEIKTCESINKYSACYPNWEMDQQKHYRIDNNILYGKSMNPKLNTIKQICDGLGITLAEFFDTDEFNNLEQEIK